MNPLGEGTSLNPAPGNDRRVLDHLAVAVFCAELGTHRLSYVNARARALLGADGERAFDAPALLGQILQPGDRARFVGLLEAVEADGIPRRDRLRLATDGGKRWLQVSIERDDGAPPQPPRLVGTLVDVTGAIVVDEDPGQELATRKLLSAQRDLLAAERELRTAAEDTERREAFLSKASRALAATLDYDAALQEVARLAIPDFADWCSVDMVAPDGTFRRVAAAIADPAKAHLARRVLEEFPPPVRVRELPGTIHTETAFLKERMPEEDLERMATSAEHARVLKELELCSVIGARLIARGRLLGEIRFCYARGSRRLYSRQDLPVLIELSRRAALAIDNARLYRESQEAKAREAFLSEASRLLSGTLDYDAALEQVARLALPTLADWCSVDIFPSEGVPVRRVAAAHANPAHAERIEQLRRLPPPRWPPPGLERFSRGGGAFLAESLPETVLEAIATSPAHFQLLRALGTGSALVVQLEARGRTLGLIRLAYGESGRRYGVGDVPLAQELARRAATALDNARLYQEAQEAIRARDEFLSIASHELRTPCTSLQLGVQSLLRLGQRGRLSQASPTLLRSILESSERQSRRLATLVDKLLDVSRIGAGRLELDLEPVDLGALAREVAEGFHEELAASGSPLHVDIGDGLLVGHWDRSRLVQVVTNLLSNAIKYGEGRPIELRVAPEGDHVRIAVLDHGIGIPPERQPQLFQRFERAVSSRHYSGLGLGLYIVRQIVLALGGAISVRSEPGGETCFEVVLPLAGPQLDPPPIGSA